MLTRDFRRFEERTRYPLKPLFSHLLLPTPSTITRLDIRLRRAALYPAELRVPGIDAVTALSSGNVLLPITNFLNIDLEYTRLLFVRFFQLGLFDLLKFAKSACGALIDLACCGVQYSDNINIA